MKSFIALIVITLAACNQGFLRHLADKAEITVSAVKFPTACNAYAKGITFTLTAASNVTTTEISVPKDMKIELVKSDDTNKKIATECTINASTTPTISCATSAAANTDGDYKPVLAADEAISGTAGQADAETLKAFTLTNTVKIQSKTYVKPSATQADAAKAIDYSTTGPYSFSITFDANMATGYLPTVKANSKTLTCTVDEKDAKKINCPVTKTDLPEDSTDKTKVVSYPVTITNVCGVDESSLITLKVSNSGSSSSQTMIMFSKIAFAILSILLF